LTPNRRLLPNNARLVFEKVSKLTKKAALSFISLREINDTCDSQTEESNFYGSNVIANLSEMRHWNFYVMELREK